MTAFSQPAMAPLPSLTLSVAATFAGIREAADAVAGFRADFGLPGQAGWPLQVALDEILSNIVRHAGTQPSQGKIEVAVELADDVVRMTISDDGPPFDPLQVEEPDLDAPLEARRPGGLGVHLVRQLMEHVEYRRDSGRNRLIMTWRPRRPAPRDA